MNAARSANLSAAQRRRIEALTEHVDRVTRGDARYFERFPARSHRIRLASSAEIAVNDALAGGPLPNSGRWYVAVKQIAPGVRLRAFTRGNPDVDTDAASEVEAKAVWDVLVRPGTKAFEIEQGYRAAIARRDADRR